MTAVIPIHASTHCERSKHELIIRGMNKMGELALCCKQQHVLPLTDNLSGLQKIKDDLANGVRNHNCTTCWLREDDGQISWRQVGNELYQKISKENTVELYLNNTCDLKCIYCSPKYSSKWVQEVSANREVVKEFINEADYDSVNYDHTDKILRLIEDVGRTADIKLSTQIVCLGGEPLLTPVIKKNVIAEIIKAFYRTADPACKLRLGIVTNCNTPDEVMNSTLAALVHYKKLYPNLEVFVSISLESIGKITEFIRYGSEFEQVNKNIRKWFKFTKDEFMDSSKISFSVTLNIVSFASTVDFLQYAIALTKEFGIEIRFGINEIMYPRHLSLSLLDEGKHSYVFDDIRSTLLDFQNWAKESNKDLVRMGFEATLTQLEKIKESFGKDSLTEKKTYANLALRYFNYLRETRGIDVRDLNNELIEYLNGLVK